MKYMSTTGAAIPESDVWFSKHIEGSGMQEDQEAGGTS